MANVFKNLRGTISALFQLGLGGPNLKANSGDIQGRNAADSAFAAIAASLFKTYGDDFELNSGATSAGADWKFTVRRPSTGMTHDITVIMPSGDPAPGQALTVSSFASNIITLGYTTVAAGVDKVVTDTTTIAFGTASPVAMFTMPANGVMLTVKVVIDTPFNGTPSLSVGITGTTSKYAPSTAFDLTAAAGTVYEYDPGLDSIGASTENIIATYAAGGATAGSARILVSYVIPS